MRTVGEWLETLGLGRYANAFAENDVDWRALPHIESSDLQELGVSLGHRRVILAAISEMFADKYRPEWVVDWANNQSNVTTMTIGRLARPQMRELVESLAGPVSDRLLDRIAERTDGIPLFVEELTRSILDAGRAPAEVVDIPDSLQGLLMARLDGLPAASKEVAQVAAVIGREFYRGLLSEISSQRGAVLDEALGNLVAAQLILRRAASNQSLSFGMP